MFRTVIWFAAAFVLTLFVGPLAFLASQIGRADPADLYIVVETSSATFSENELASFGAREIGPLRSIFAKLVQAPPVAREQMLKIGTIMLPASTLAALCNIDGNQKNPKLRNG